MESARSAYLAGYKQAQADAIKCCWIVEGDAPPAETASYCVEAIKALDPTKRLNEHLRDQVTAAISNSTRPR